MQGPLAVFSTPISSKQDLIAYIKLFMIFSHSVYEPFLYRIWYTRSRIMYSLLLRVLHELNCSILSFIGPWTIHPRKNVARCPEPSIWYHDHALRLTLVAHDPRRIIWHHAHKLRMLHMTHNPLRMTSVTTFYRCAGPLLVKSLVWPLYPRVVALRIIHVAHDPSVWPLALRIRCKGRWSSASRDSLAC